MVIGSHNSWSYLRPRRWWMILISFAARCQRVDIREQYLKYGVRCFDLRIRYDGICIISDVKHINTRVSHGIIEYDIDVKSLCNDLEWLDKKSDCYVRVIHEVRNKKQMEQSDLLTFQRDCYYMQDKYPHIKFWCGRNLYDWKVDYQFEGEEPTCEETYGSVVPGKKWLYGWWPWLYAVTHNKAIKAQGTDKDILLIDFVDLG